VNSQRHAPAAVYSRERPGTHFTGGWLGPRACLDGRNISCPPGSITELPARSQSLNRLNYPAHVYIYMYTHTHTDTHITVDVVLHGKLRQNIVAHLPDNKTSYFIIHYLLVLQQAKILIPYRNNRKSSEAHYGQYNQKVATQRDIQCIF